MNAIEFTHAAKVCARLERELRASISGTQTAIREAQAAVQGMPSSIRGAPRAGSRLSAPISCGPSARQLARRLAKSWRRLASLALLRSAALISNRMCGFPAEFFYRKPAFLFLYGKIIRGGGL
jgi:hypothetical protein